MPDEYISREKTLALLKSLGSRDYRREKGTIQDAIKMISSAAYTPAADVAEVVHGRWHLLDDCANAGLYCSACGRRVHREEFAYKKLRSKYCPHCGARMDGAAE